jgi:hypothetical protein
MKLFGSIFLEVNIEIFLLNISICKFEIIPTFKTLFYLKLIDKLYIYFHFIIKLLKSITILIKNNVAS